MDEQQNADVRSNLYQWLDSVPFSRPKKRLERYFADASAVVELINFFNPKFALQNAYPPCLKRASKIDNWERLNQKVLSRLGMRLTKDQINDLADAKLECTEAFLCELAAVLYRKNYATIQRTLEQTRHQQNATGQED